MDLLIKQANLLLMVLLLGESEVELVRKKLKWKYKPFEIPKEILNEWRKIGEKGMLLKEKKWNKFIIKKVKK